MQWVGAWPLAALTLLVAGPPANGYDAERKVEAARLYGSVGGYAYYFVDLLIGSPEPQRASVIVDTGSAICAFPCKGCRHCGKHLDAPFDFLRSTTANWIPCSQNSQNFCSRCIDGRCSYTQSYTEGSSITGSWFDDVISLGDAFQHNPPVHGRLGCHSQETKLFYTQKANGIFGMAPGQSGKPPTILEDLFRDRQHIDAALFALCLAEEGGLLTVGGYNASLHVTAGDGAVPEVLWIPMASLSYYAIQLAEVALEGGGVLLSGGFGHTFVDSGTTYTYFPGALYRKLDVEISRYCRSHRNCGGHPKGGTCWMMPPKLPATALSGFPLLRITFASGGKMLWRPQSYLYRRDGTGNTWCYGFQDNGHAQETVLGATWLLHRNVVFDIAGRRLGLAEARCPAFRRRPPAPAGRSAAISSRTKEQMAGVVAEGRPALFTAVLTVLVVTGLLSVGLYLRLAGQRAKHRLSVEAARASTRRSRPSPLQLNHLRSLAAEYSSAPPTFIGKGSLDADEGGDGAEDCEAAGVCITPLEIWLQPGPGSGSAGGTPGSGSGVDSSSGTQAHEDLRQLLE